MNRLSKASPWPFLGLAGMAAVLFVFAASVLLVPGWYVAVLLLLWAVCFVVACRWWTRHPGWVPLSPVVLVVFWFASVNAGGAWLGWTA